VRDVDPDEAEFPFDLAWVHARLTDGFTVNATLMAVLERPEAPGSAALSGRKAAHDACLLSASSRWRRRHLERTTFLLDSSDANVYE
jgi:hypothetical protein